MINRNCSIKFLAGLLVCLCCGQMVQAQQVLSLKEALAIALENYPIIQAKKNYVNASEASVKQSKREALPNLVIAAQQSYGTVNGQNGPLYGFGGYGVSSSGLPLPEQNWNAAFGAAYIANVNWDFFTFGRVRNRIKVSEATVNRDVSDQQQEQFEHQVRVADAYLNLMAAQLITISLQKNLDRADTFRTVVATRAKNGLIAGVDSSMANAEISNAKIALTRARDAEQERANQLAVLMGVSPREFILDTLFVSEIPPVLDSDTSQVNTVHPVLQYYRNRIGVSEQQTSYFSKLRYPVFSMFGIFQTRGSGFASNYASDQTAYSQDYFNAIKPSRSNYLFGVGVTWNLTSLPRVKQQVIAQKFVSEALQDEYELADQQITAQLALANNKIRNAISNYRETPVQVKAASDAYMQRSVLYKSGLSNIVDVTQTLYALTRAETDRAIAYTEVWRALLLQAAAVGDLQLFTNEL